MNWYSQVELRKTTFTISIICSISLNNKSTEMYNKLRILSPYRSFIFFLKQLNYSMFNFSVTLFCAILSNMAQIVVFFLV